MILKRSRVNLAAALYLLSLGFPFVQVIQANAELVSQNSNAKEKADLYQALLKRVLKQIENIDMTLEELAEAVNNNSIRVDDKKSIIDHLTTVRNFVAKLKNEKIFKFSENNLDIILELNKALIMHLNSALTQNLKGIKSFSQIKLLDGVAISDEAALIKRSESSEVLNYSKILLMLKENDDLLNKTVFKNRIAGTTPTNRFFRSAEKFAQENNIIRIGQRLLPYGLLGLWIMYNLDQADIPDFLRPVKKFMGGIPSKRDVENYDDRVAPRLAIENSTKYRTTQYVNNEGILGTPAYYLRHVIDFKVEPIISLTLAGYFAPIIKRDASDLYKWSAEKSRSLMAKLKAERYEEPTPLKESKIALDSIIGFDHAKSQLKEVANYFKTKELRDRTGTHIDRGYLMVGPMDIAKQLSHGLADAITKELKAQGKKGKCGIYEVHSSTLVKKTISDIIKEVEELAYISPSVIFIDDLSWLAKNAKSDTKIWADLVSAMSSNLRGIKKQVIVIAATTDSSQIDTALKGIGRLGSIIQFDKPSAQERKAFFEKELAKRSVRKEEFDLERLALYTENCSYDILASIVKNAFGKAHENRTIMNQEHLEQSISAVAHNIILDKYYFNKDQQEMLAAHYAGQALVHALKVPCAFKVTTLPVGNKDQGKLKQGALIAHSCESNKDFITNEDLQTVVIVKLAGIEAQKMLNGKVSHEFSKQVKQEAFALAKQIEFEGISDKDFSKNLKEQKLSAVYTAIEEASKAAAQILSENEVTLKAIAHELKDKYILTDEDIKNIIEKSSVSETTE